MRSLQFLVLCFLCTVVLAAGCSRTENASSTEKSPKDAASGGWASAEKPKAVDATLPKSTGQVSEVPAEPALDNVDPVAAPNVEPAVMPNEEPAAAPNMAPIEIPSLEEITRKPDSNEQPESGAPEQGTADQENSDRESPALPPDAFTPPQEPAPASDVPNAEPTEPEQPKLHNPLRDKEHASGVANPMRQQQAPLPLNTPTGEHGTADAVLPNLPDTLPSSVPNEDNTSSGKAASVGPNEEPFDPIKENGPIFVDWPKPKLALVMTGRENGYIEPCGCAGLDRMKGGLSRRHSMVESLREKEWPLVCLDAGGQVKGYGRQTEIKFQITVEGMRKIGYDAIGFGVKDLQLPAAELVSVAASPSPFVSANVGLFGFDAQLTEQTKIVEAAGLKIGITSVLGESEHGKVKGPDVELASTEQSIAKILPGLKKECNLLVLMVDGTKEESIALARKFPDFQLVVTTGGPPEPPAEPMRIPNTRSLLIEVGEKGADAIVVGLYDDPKKPLRYQRVPLDSRFKASKDMYRIMVAYQEQLKQLGLDGLGIRPVSHPQREVNGDFVGSEQCKSCHEESYRIWKKSGHAKAWKTLVENDPPRNFDPECISCHVIGWHPTRHFPYKTGFLSEKKTPEMLNVGCESCHGPGGAHCRAENGSDLAFQEQQYKAVRVTKEEAQTNLTKMCQNCHDLDNSPEFNFETYWPKVEHYEDDE